jgi:hypothetical protein
VIDGASDTVAAEIQGCLGAADFCFSPTHDRVYVANSASSSISVVRSSQPGIEESFGLKVLNPKPVATVVRGVLVLGAVDSRQNAVDGAELLDASGRKVMDLTPGENDVRALAPGIYFVRTSASVRIRKVIVIH